jgi:hypothetical protein
MGKVLEQSINWDKYCESSRFIEEGFPFDEGFPKNCGPTDDKIYQLIARTGERYLAEVDFSTQYRAEGLNWKRLDRGTNYDKGLIVAWREINIDRVVRF